jgi:hypothetical protein
MLVYAVCLLISGYVTMSVAPPGSKPATAFIIPAVAAGLSIAAAVLALMIKSNRKLGMIGIHVGLLLPLVFAVGFFMRIDDAYGSSGVNRYFQNAYEQKVKDGAEDDTEKARRAFFVNARDELSGKDIPETDKAYLGRTLTLLFGASTAAFVLLLLSRPEVPAKPADSFGDDAKPSKPESTSDAKAFS